MGVALSWILAHLAGAVGQVLLLLVGGVLFAAAVIPVIDFCRKRYPRFSEHPATQLLAAFVGFLAVFFVMPTLLITLLVALAGK